VAKWRRDADIPCPGVLLVSSLGTWKCPDFSKMMLFICEIACYIWLPPGFLQLVLLGDLNNTDLSMELLYSLSADKDTISGLAVYFVIQYQ